jgi:hypothetical protein
MKYKILVFGLMFSTILSACGMQGNHGTTTVTGQQSNTGMQVNLAWSAVAGAQEGFYVEESTNGNTFTQISTVPDGINTLSVSVPSPGVYYFRVRSYNQAGTSPYTAVVPAQVAEN